MKKFIAPIVALGLGLSGALPTMAEEDFQKEKESNNTIETANVEDYYYDMRGTLTAGDVDYFKLSVERLSTLYLLGGEIEDEYIVENQNLSLRVVNEDLEEIMVADYLEEEGLNYSEQLVTSGDFYIEVKNLGQSTIPYAFLADYSLGFYQVYGADRYQTSINLSNSWDEAENVVMTTGANFPDALSATPLAKKLDAPLLLSNPNKSSLSGQLKGELKRLSTKNVYIVGGTAAVPASIEKELKNLGLKVTRIYGSDRYKTSVKVAEKVGNNGEVAVTVGTNFADALAMSPVAAAKGMPILLTDGKTVSSDVKSYVNKSGVKKSYVIGGTAAISDSVKKALPGSERISGSNRYATNQAILSKFKKDIDFSSTFIATGENYPDALSGSALAAHYNSPLVLVNKYVETDDLSLNPAVQNTIDQYKYQIGEFIVVGGENAVSPETTFELYYLWDPAAFYDVNHFNSFQDHQWKN